MSYLLEHSIHLTPNKNHREPPSDAIHVSIKTEIHTLSEYKMYSEIATEDRDGLLPSRFIVRISLHDVHYLSATK